MLIDICVFIFILGSPLDKYKGINSNTISVVIAYEEFMWLFLGSNSNLKIFTVRTILPNKFIVHTKKNRLYSEDACVLGTPKKYEVWEPILIKP